MSVVLRLHHQNHPVILIPGDLDSAGLADLKAQGRHIQADILLFPHHGGHIGHGGAPAARARENAVFAQAIVEQVKPRLLLFSIGRGRFGTPRPEIVKQILAEDNNCQIHCTQLSEHCHVGSPTGPAAHLTDLPASGREQNACCGGSIEIPLKGTNTIANLNRQRHVQFVNSVVPTPLCKPAPAPSRP